MTVRTFVCPRCKESWTGHPALSRVDNKTDICSPCGTQEGLDDYFGVPLQSINQLSITPVRGIHRVDRLWTDETGQSKK